MKNNKLCFFLLLLMLPPGPGYSQTVLETGTGALDLEFENIYPLGAPTWFTTINYYVAPRVDGEEVCLITNSDNDVTIDISYGLERKTQKIKATVEQSATSSGQRLRVDLPSNPFNKPFGYTLNSVKGHMTIRCPTTPYTKSVHTYAYNVGIDDQHSVSAEYPLSLDPQHYVKLSVPQNPLDLGVLNKKSHYSRQLFVQEGSGSLPLHKIYIDNELLDKPVTIPIKDTDHKLSIDKSGKLEIDTGTKEGKFEQAVKLTLLLDLM